MRLPIHVDHHNAVQFKKWPIRNGCCLVNLEPGEEITHDTGAMPVVQRIVDRVLSFHHLFACKSKWKICVGNELRDMRHLYMGVWAFLPA